MFIVCILLGITILGFRYARSHSPRLGWIADQVNFKVFESSRKKVTRRNSKFKNIEYSGGDNECQPPS